MTAPSAPVMADSRPLASVSLDVDNQWSYMKTHGDAGWEARPSYYPVFFDTTLRALDALNMRITFFVVGRDAAVPAHHDQLRAVIAAGHEVGNHSFEHEPWLHRYTPEQLASEIGNCGSGDRGGDRPQASGLPRARVQLESDAVRGPRRPRLHLMMRRRCPRTSGRSPAPTTSGPRT